MVKRCFICGSKEDSGHCTNPDCPRYKNEISSETEKVADEIQKSS